MSHTTGSSRALIRDSSDVTVLFPPRHEEFEITSLHGTLQFAMREELAGWPWMLAVGECSGGLAFAFGFDDPPTSDLLAALFGISRTIVAGASFVLVSRPPLDDGVHRVAERDLERWRAWRGVAEEAGAVLLDWIVAGPSVLRSTAVLTGDAPDWWDQRAADSG